MSETGDWRELIRECGESSEKGTKGWAELERSRGIQRCLVCHISSIREVQKQGQDIVSSLVIKIITPVSPGGD